MQSIHPLVGSTAKAPHTACVVPDLQPSPVDTCVRKVSLDAELAVWVDSEAARMGMSFGSFVSTLLEWARSEDIPGDDDLGLFMGPDRTAWQSHA